MVLIRRSYKETIGCNTYGTQWNEDDICEQTRNRIQSIINGDIDEKIKERMGRTFSQLSDFQGLPEWLACYVVYGRTLKLQIYNGGQSQKT